eukprot:4925339-Ditylum_brightwellii.AAC.1
MGPSMWEGAPFRLSHVITNVLTFILTPPPTFRDKFHSVQELVQSFNNCMHHIFILGWVSCGDKSMSI